MVTNINCQFTGDILTVPLHTLKQCLGDVIISQLNFQSHITLEQFLLLFVTKCSSSDQSEHCNLIKDIIKVYSTQVWKFYKSHDNLKEVFIPPDWTLTEEYADTEHRSALAPSLQKVSTQTDISVATSGQISPSTLHDVQDRKVDFGGETEVKEDRTTYIKRRKNPTRISRTLKTKDIKKRNKPYHGKSTRGKTAFRCIDCSKIFNSRSLYDQHKCEKEKQSDNPITSGDNSKDKTFACECGHSFSTEAARNSHMKKSHASDTNSVYKCTDCVPPYSTTSKKEIQEHKCENNSTCELCDEVFPTSQELKQHICIKSKVGSAYECRFCSKSFKCKSYWKDHEALHRGKTFNCDMCEQKCASSKGLKYHKSQHDPDAYTPCEICGKMFSSHRLLKQHVATHDEPAHTCPKCHKKFKSLRNMTRHIQFSHNVQNPTKDDLILCSTCGRRYTCRSELVVHIRRFHTKELPFKCSFCDKRFVCKGDARKHERIHTNERNYACHQCSRKFRDSSTLCRHLHTHLSFKPFACQICDSGFTQLTTFKKHALSHGYDKDFKDILERRIEKSSFLKYNENLAETKPKPSQKPSTRKLPKVDKTQKQQEHDGLQKAQSIRNILSTANMQPYNETGDQPQTIYPLYLQQQLQQQTPLQKPQQQHVVNVASQQHQALQHLLYNTPQHSASSDVLNTQPPAYVPPVNNDLYPLHLASITAHNAQQQHLTSVSTHNTQHSNLKTDGHLELDAGQLVNNLMSTGHYGQHLTTHRHDTQPTAFQVNSIDIQEDGLTLLMNAVNSFHTP